MNLLTALLRLRSFLGYNLFLFTNFFILFCLIYEIDLNENISILVKTFTSYATVGFAGFILNDIFDINKDVLAKKPNMAIYLGKSMSYFFVVFGFLAGYILLHSIINIASLFLLLQFMLLLSYSVPAIRFKEQDKLGLVVDAMYAHVVPSTIILFVVMKYADVNAYVFASFLMFSFLIGIKHIINHQIEDYDNDLLSNTKTYTTQYGLEVANRTHNFFFYFSSIVFLLFILILLIAYYSNFLLVISSLCFVAIVISVIAMKISGDNTKQTELPTSVYLVISSIVLIVILITKKQYYAIPFLINPNLILFAYHKVYNKLILGTYYTILMILSLTVNYSLYYVFLLFGRNLKQKPFYVKRNVIESEPNNIVISKNIIEKKVHGLWIGKNLSKIEMLTINSFIQNGYIFHLWTYEKIENDLHEKCLVCNANEIIDKSKVFSYKYNSQFGIGKGSVAGFSDIFRYKLLYEKGGWWVDMDITCLKPFDTNVPYLFRPHHELLLVGNIMKVPKGSKLMLDCYEEAIKNVDANNRDWHKPIEILINNVKKYGLEKFIVKDFSNTDEWHLIKYFVTNNKIIPENWFVIHWCNEAWKSEGISKNEIKYNSTIGELLLRYKLLPELSADEAKKHDSKIQQKIVAKKILELI
jgi:hypothetical protein